MGSLVTYHKRVLKYPTAIVALPIFPYVSMKLCVTYFKATSQGI